MLKQTITGLALIAAALATGGAAHAADLSRPVYKAPPPVAPIFSWTGFYIGANIGGGFARARATVDGVSGSEDLNGILGGGQIGYNWQTGNWILGIEADFQGTDQHANFAGTVGPITVTRSDSLPWFATVRGRVGYAIAPMWMIYATGGGAWVDFKSTITDSAFGNSATWETSHGGWTAGAGIEAAIDHNWSWKVEYLHLDTGTVNTTLFGVVAASARVTDDIGRVGINYRF